MGLDNEIYVRARRKIDAPQEIMWSGSDWYNPSTWDEDSCDFKYDKEWYERSLCYWRKCYNIRNLMLESLSENSYDGRGGSVFISVDELKTFYKKLYKLNSAKGWEDNDDSIWTYREMRATLDQHLLNIEWLINLCERSSEEIMIEFIDSY